MFWKPNVVVAAIVPQDNRFLFVEEEPDNAGVVLNQPAGHLDFGETPAEAAVRETLEETAWHIEPLGIVGFYLYTKPDTDITYLRICFHAKPLRFDSERALDRDIIRAVWLTQEEVLSMENCHRSPLVRRCLEDYLDGNSFPLHMICHHPW